MSGRGIPEAESDDQSWMDPAPSKKRAAPEYNEYNPPPVVKDPVAYAEAVRQIRKSFVWIGLGIAMLALSLYLFLN